MKRQALAALLLLALIVLAHAGQDYYKILHVPRTASTKDIRRAFKKLSLKYHPDKNKDNPEKAKLKFQEIVNAYETLIDPEKKQIYDQYGKWALALLAAQVGL